MHKSPQSSYLLQRAMETSRFKLYFFLLKKDIIILIVPINNLILLLFSFSAYLNINDNDVVLG